MCPDSPSFDDLLARARTGNAGAWEELFARFADEEGEGAILLAIARKVLPPGDRARDFVESRDLLQSALRSGWFHATDFRGNSSAEFIGWIRTILRRKLGRAVRRKTPRPGGDQVADKAEEPAGAEPVDPLARLVREEVRERVQKAVQELPEDQRVVMDLRLQGLKAPDIAGMLGLTAQAVRKRESRAAGRLREILGIPEERNQ